jgi:hypothetical protein
MGARLSLDDELVRRARELTEIEDMNALARAALVALIERESSRRLARLGGIAPNFVVSPRRR